MTAAHQRPGGSDGSPFGNLAGRGVALVVAAVVIGFVLLSQGFGDRSDGDAAAPAPTTTAPPSSTTAAPNGQNTGGNGGNGGNGGEGEGDGAPQTTVLETVLPPEEVSVLAANGSGEPGVAGALEAKLSAQNYVTEASNANPTEASQILYRPGYSENARLIAESLAVDAGVIVRIGADEPAPVPDEATERAATSNIIVIAGSDGVIR